MPDDLWALQQREYYPIEKVVVSELYNFSLPMTYLKIPIPKFFQRAISEADWDRFEYYAPKIHHLVITDNAGIDADVLAQIYAYQPTKPLLSRLQILTLDLNLENAPLFPNLPSLIVGSIRRLFIITPLVSGPQCYTIFRNFLNPFLRQSSLFRPISNPTPVLREHPLQLSLGSFKTFDFSASLGEIWGKTPCLQLEASQSWNIYNLVQKETPLQTKMKM